jgi:hypothetical protein
MSESMSEQKAKEQAKERDGWECQFCGVSQNQHKEEYGRGLHAHHIIKSSDGGIDHPRNLITVCRDCHNTLENTQAEALSRIKASGGSQERVKELETELEQAKEAIHEVARVLINGDGIQDVIEGSTLELHILTQENGEKVAVRQDADGAVTGYKLWADRVDEKNPTVEEYNAEQIADRIGKYWKKGWLK